MTSTEPLHLNMLVCIEIVMMNKHSHTNEFANHTCLAIGAATCDSSSSLSSLLLQVHAKHGFGRQALKRCSRTATVLLLHTITVLQGCILEQSALFSPIVNMTLFQSLEGVKCNSSMV